MKKIFIIVGMILIVTGLLGAFLSHQGNFTDEEIVEIIRAPVKVLTIEADNTPITIVPTDQDDFTVIFSGMKIQDLTNALNVATNDESLTITVDQDNWLFFIPFITQQPQLIIKKGIDKRDRPSKLRWPKGLPFSFFDT